MNSAIYTGWVQHRRMTGKRHSFRYRLFMPFIDLDELPQLLSRSWGWSANRPALARFRREDFMGDPTLPLKQAVLNKVEAETGECPDGAVFMLANLRYFGFLINPITCYYCFSASGDLQALVAEVTNTPWNERHSYVLTMQDREGWLEEDFDKAMHVSPFMPMEMRYHWRSNVPGDRLILHLANSEAGQKCFDATLHLDRKSGSPSNFTRQLLLYPFMTARIAGAIYWQALRLWLKGIPFVSHPKSLQGENQHE